MSQLDLMAAPASPAPISGPISRRVPSRVLAVAEPLSAPRDRTEFVLRILDEYVAAVGTSRPRRSEARKLRERAAASREQFPHGWSGALSDADQLEQEANDRDEVALRHEERAERLRMTLTAHVSFPHFPPE